MSTYMLYGDTENDCMYYSEIGYHTKGLQDSYLSYVWYSWCIYIGPVHEIAGIYSAHTWMKMMIVITQAQLNSYISYVASYR